MQNNIVNLFHNNYKVANIWGNEKELIADYIFDKFNNAIKNHLINTELVACFDLITHINTIYPLETHFAKKTDEKILPNISTIIKNTRDYVNLCKYALLRVNQKDNIIKNILIKECVQFEEQKKPVHFKSLFNAVLQIFQDKETSMDLSSTYTQYHNYIETINFSNEQITHLISNKYIEDRFQELPREENTEITLNTETDIYIKIKWLFENKKNIDVNTYELLFAAVIVPGSLEERMRGKSIDDVARILSFVNPLLNLIPDRKLTTQSQTLYKLIVEDRQIPNPSYRQGYNIQQFLTKNFIDECINENKYISEISEFVINTYRISNNKIKTETEIGKLLKKTNLDTDFLQLINKGYNLDPILGLIFDGNDNYEEDRLSLLQHCFNQENDKKQYVISENKAKTKLNDLLNFAQKENSNDVFTLLETLSEQERYKNLLTSLIIEKDSVFVNSLPQKLLKLSVNSFNKDNYNDYANNFEFLSVIIQNGNNYQKGDVVKILIAKLDNDQDIEQVLILIDKMIDIPTFDKSGLLHSHLDSYQRNNKENISEEVCKKIEQLKKKTK